MTDRTDTPNVDEVIGDLEYILQTNGVGEPEATTISEAIAALSSEKASRIKAEAERDTFFRVAEEYQQEAGRLTARAEQARQAALEEVADVIRGYPNIAPMYLHELLDRVRALKGKPQEAI